MYESLINFYYTLARLYWNRFQIFTTFAWKLFNINPTPASEFTGSLMGTEN
jgi:hypothetical protein